MNKDEIQELIDQGIIEQSPSNSDAIRLTEKGMTLGRVLSDEDSTSLELRFYSENKREMMIMSSVLRSMSIEFGNLANTNTGGSFIQFRAWKGGDKNG